MPTLQAKKPKTKKPRSSASPSHALFDYLVANTIKTVEGGKELFSTVYIVTATDSPGGLKVIDIKFDESNDDMLSMKQQDDTLRYSGKILQEAKIKIDMVISMRQFMGPPSIFFSGMDEKKNVRVDYYKIRQGNGFKGVPTKVVKSPFLTFPDRWVSRSEMKRLDIKFEDSSLNAIMSGYNES